MGLHHNTIHPCQKRAGHALERAGGRGDQWQSGATALRLVAPLFEVGARWFWGVALEWGTPNGEIRAHNPTAPQPPPLAERICKTRPKLVDLAVLLLFGPPKLSRWRRAGKQ